ncbi:hypothetical protein LbFV_ORF20 [Leptopilina boulardi filamentous virus]|uniref:Uncharacterized protein n=1 Tax=Leptopilina boulardi filamentous virus TaxID=552509 RepID=A0A1S5YCZ2_9VIRU|nr:hypothetical protein LbFV_ORF20 [Leptopilina boulardi filamentous virus]AQQ79940.1 hypothetical protein LbFV_ORF20 [Leptopilina boulardi filamentous virus]
MAQEQHSVQIQRSAPRLGEQHDDRMFDSENYNNDKENENEECNKHIPYIMSIQQITKKSTDGINESISVPKCIFHVGNRCGTVNLDRKGGLDTSQQSLLIGNFCEYHFMKYLNGIYVSFSEGTNLSFLPINYNLVKNPMALFPIVCCLPINLPQQDITAMFESSHLNGEHLQDEVTYLSKLISLLVKDINIEDNFNTHADNMFSQRILEYTVAWRHKLQEYLGFWKNDEVNLYFTSDYLEKNKKQSFLLSLKRIGKKIEFPNTTSEDDIDIVGYKVLIKHFPIFDILTIKSYECCMYSDGSTLESTLPNIQIFNGMLYYGVGFGLTNQFPYNTNEYNKSIEYRDLLLSKQINHRPILSNTTPLFIDGMAVSSKKKAVFVVSS